MNNKILRNEKLQIFILVIFGTIIRLISIISRDFWFDEALTYHFSKLPINQLLTTVLQDSNPPFYYLLIHLLLKIENQDFFLRLPSLFFNLLTILILYILGKKIFNKTIGFITAFLFTISPLNIYISSEARLHSLAVFLTTLSVLFFYNLLTNLSKKNTILFIIIMTLSLYTQYYSLLIIPVLILIAYQNQLKVSLVYWFKIIFLVILLFLPWLIPYLLINHNECNCPNTYLSLPSTLISPLLNGVGEITLRKYSQLPFAVLFIFAISAIINVCFFIKGMMTKNFIKYVYLFPLIIISILGLFLPVFSPKGFVIFSPIYFLIVSLGIYKSKYNYIYFIIISILYLLINIILLTNPFFTGTKTKLFIPIISNQTTVTKIMHISPMTYYPWTFYFKEKENILLTKNPYPDTFLKYIPGKKQLINDKELNNFWLVDSKELVEPDERQQIFDTIQKNYISNYYFEFNNIRLNLWQKKY